MTFLLDTTTFSDLMREHPKIDARLASIERLSQGKRRQELEAKVDRLFAAIPCKPIPEGAGDNYAQAKVTSGRRGLALDENDLWIAATAMTLGAVLVSRDTDFRQIDRLTVNDWTA